MKKILITSGCSFTFEDWCWPTHLSKKINIDLLNVGMVSQGNGLISRKLIYNTEKVLKKYDAKNILVGVMWSGVDRHEYHTYSTKKIYWGWPANGERNTNIENPTKIVDDNYNWRIMNHHWEDKECRTYYEMYHTHISSMVYTIEHILRTQWYLEINKIDYFMTTYMDIFFDKTIVNNPEVNYLYKKINFSKFLPITGCYEWVNENYKNTGGFNPPDKNGYIGIHPTEYGHLKFTDEIIYPNIKNII